MSAKPVTIGPFPKGMNNRLPDTDLKVRGGPGVSGYSLLRAGVNIELTSTGKLRRRHGYAKVKSGDGMHSLWAPDAGIEGFYCAPPHLMRLTPNLQSYSLRTDMTAALVSYTQVPDGTIYYSDGQRIGRVTGQLNSTTWGYDGDDIDPDSPDYYLAALPAGRIVRYSRGRLLSAFGRELCFSEPYKFSKYNPQRNVVRLPTDITLVVPCDEGVIVVADKTYWLGGNIATAKLEERLPYGGVPGSDAYFRSEDEAVWMSVRGLCRVGKGGEVVNMQEANVIVEEADAGATYFREREGTKQAVSSMFGQHANGMAARTYMDGEIIRKGTTL